jgi:hypothetical protein
MALADAPQWSNKHLLLPLVDDKWKMSVVKPRLEELVTCMAPLCKVGVEVCHCAEEFIPPWIRLLGRRKKLVRVKSIRSR